MAYVGGTVLPTRAMELNDMAYSDTRSDAYQAIKPTAGDLRDRCAAALRGAALTADEVAERINETVLAVRPRMTELAQAGRIVKTIMRRPNASGKKAAVWMAA